MRNNLQVSEISLKNKGWLNEGPVKQIFELLNPSNALQTLFVGGCVRNALLGKDVDDIDMATSFSPQEVMRILEADGIKVIPTGLDHGTVTAVLDERSFEITTLRKDVETDGRHAEVAFTDSWLEDAKRRDFTMNTLLADIEGQVFDPLGNGIEDLKKGRVAFVGKPDQRIEEDYLRILRFFRFFALYGVGEPDKTALKACKDHADKINGLSKERISQEFFKILMAEQAPRILNLMFDNNVLCKFSISQSQMQNFEHFCIFQDRYGLASVSSRLFVLADLRHENLDIMLELLLCPKVFIKDMQAISSILDLPDLDNNHAVKVAIYKYGRVASAQALMIELVQDRVMNGYAPKALEIIQNWDVPNFPLSGDDLIKGGLKPGPKLGQELQEFETKWIESEFSLSKQELLSSF